jgi:hypothetical protein
MKIKQETDRQARDQNFQRELLRLKQKDKKWNKYLKVMVKEEKNVKLKRIAFMLILVIASG